MSTYNFNESPSTPQNSNSIYPQAPGSDHSNSTQTAPTGNSNKNVTVYQTTGPDAYTGPVETPGGSGQAALNPRSCVTCRRRKVRCDKQMPCSNCRRALIPCIFPAPGRAPRQPRPKDPNAPPKASSQREVELLKRLRKLEGIVEDLSGQVEVEPTTGKPASAANSPSDHSAIRRAASVPYGHANGNSAGGTASQGFSPKEITDSASESSDRRKEVHGQLGRLVLNDHKGSTRYISHGFWAKLNDELDTLRDETHRLTDDDSDESDYDDTPESSPPGPAAHMQDHHAFILGYRSADVDLRPCHPVSAQVPFLWSVYQDNVEPLVKIIHVPSMEIVFRDVRKDCTKLTPGMEALIFCIYYSAVVSMDEEEVQATLSASKDHLCRKYRFALEQSLAKANYLSTSDFVVLQAFTLFLIVVRRFDDSRFCWTLTGLAIRIAQGMGLQRDGTNFDMTPFETEMRRRLWWALLTLDLRAAEELGTDMAITEDSYDTQRPSNVNDADMFPNSTEPLVCQEGRSDVAVVNMRYEILNLSRRWLRDDQMKTPDSQAPNIQEKERLLQDLYEHVRSKYVSTAIAGDTLYTMAAIVARIITAKINFFIYQSNAFTGSGSDTSTEVIRERCYFAAIEFAELGYKIKTDPVCRQYKWLFMTYTNWHAIAYTLVETCRRPWTALVERAWEAVNKVDGDPIDIEKSADHAAVFLPLRKLYLRASRYREAEVARLRSQPEEARRLDFKERMRAVEARFGPVPGSENRMQEARDKWRDMIFRDGTGYGTKTWAAQGSSSEGGTPMQIAAPLPPQQQNMSFAPAAPQDLSRPSQVELSDAAMDYMDDFMAQSHLNVAALWPIHDDITEQHRAISGLPLSPTSGFPGQLPSNGNAVRQRVMQMAPPSQVPQMRKDNNPPPFLWPGVFGANDPKLDASGDMDMLGVDFDWQDWNQSLQNLAQPQGGI